MDDEMKEGLVQMLQSMAELPDSKRRAMNDDLDNRNIALLRLLAVESALIAHYGELGGYPAELSDLTPQFICETPPDPFSGAKFHYERTVNGYILYSPGPTGRDSGGNLGSWSEVESGEKDLGVDMFEFCDAFWELERRPTLFSRATSGVGQFFRRLCHSPD